MANNLIKDREIEENPESKEENVDGSRDGSDSPAQAEARLLSVIRVDHNRYRGIYHAAIKGDWKMAEKIIKEDPEALRAEISMLKMTALHIAAGSGHSHFVEQLAKRLPPEALEVKAVMGQGTALHYAVFSGSLKTVETLVRHNQNLTEIKDHMLIPLMAAVVKARKNQREIVWFLYLKTKNLFPDPVHTQLPRFLCMSGLHDVTVHLLKRYPDKALIKNEAGFNLLTTLASKPDDFFSGSRLTFWERWIYKFAPDTLSDSAKGDAEDTQENLKDLAQVPTSKLLALLVQVRQWLREQIWKAMEPAPCSKKVRYAKLRHKSALKLVFVVCEELSRKQTEEVEFFFQGTDVLYVAAGSGIVEMIRVCLHFFPDLIWMSKSEKSLWQHAVIFRQEKIFSLSGGLTELSKMFHSTPNKSGNTILHEAAKLAPPERLSSVSCPALQMQRELQWFKEVEKWIKPELISRRNEDKKTARELFTEEHEDLARKGERWMKDTSNSCMVVATLISTVVFAAAFTVPGGNSSEGVPIFLGKNAFEVFIISDALALLSSLTSLLMFLSILTAKYAEEDFLKSLPLRLIIGLATLFFAIAAVMTSFVATLWIILNDRVRWVTIPITALASIPVTLFVTLQLPLFFDMCQSTCGAGIFRPQKLWYRHSGRSVLEYKQDS